MQTRAIHELKTWPHYFAAVRAGTKTFEIRKNDRDFVVGDTLILQEFDPEDGAYTGQIETRAIRFLLSEEDFGVIHGFVAIGFGPLPAHEPAREGESLSADTLAHWHQTCASNAAMRAQEALKVAGDYRRPREGRQAVLVAANRHQAVSDLASAESRFHAAAAAIVAQLVAR